MSASSALAIGLALGTATLPANPTDKPAPPPAQARPSPAESDEKEAELKTFKDIPVGQTFRGLRIPQRTADGRLLMQFDTTAATKVDDSHLQLEGLRIEIHNEDNSTFHIEMPRSIFDLESRILVSDTRTRIRRQDFEIFGDAAEFHTRTKFGRMIGNVKMVIFNTQNIQ